MGFWRESVQWWIGRGDYLAWEKFNAPIAGGFTGGDREKITYDMTRNWPVKFVSTDSVRALVRVIESFGNPPPPYSVPPIEPGERIPVNFTAGEEKFTNVEDFLTATDVSLRNVSISINSDIASVSVTINGTVIRKTISGPMFGPFVHINGTQRSELTVDTTRIEHVARTLVDCTKPMTRWQRWRKTPVVPRQSEIEALTHRLTRRLTILSSTLGALFGLVGGVVITLITTSGR